MATSATKLRRGATDHPSTATPANTLWRGIDINQLAEIVSTNHLQKKLWNVLIQTCTKTFEDHAIALVQYHRDGRRVVIAEDGLHDTLKKVISEPQTNHPFLLAPKNIFSDISQNMPVDDKRRNTYEFIEHYWGWQALNENETPIFLMLFGPDKIEPPEQAHSLAKLVQFICENTASEKTKTQLASDLLAETQGMRISLSAALARKVEHWASRDGH